MVAYARNDHLDFTIPYEWQGVRHEYPLDDLIRWQLPSGGEVKTDRGFRIPPKGE